MSEEKDDKDSLELNEQFGKLVKEATENLEI